MILFGYKDKRRKREKEKKRNIKKNTNRMEYVMIFSLAFN
jgi:hypothetical protein